MTEEEKEPYTKKSGEFKVKPKSESPPEGMEEVGKYVTYSKKTH